MKISTKSIGRFFNGEISALIMPEGLSSQRKKIVNLIISEALNGKEYEPIEVNGYIVEPDGYVEEGILAYPIVVSTVGDGRSLYSLYIEGVIISYLLNTKKFFVLRQDADRENIINEYRYNSYVAQETLSRADNYVDAIENVKSFATVVEINERFVSSNKKMLMSLMNKSVPTELTSDEAHYTADAFRASLIKLRLATAEYNKNEQALLNIIAPHTDVAIGNAEYIVTDEGITVKSLADTHDPEVSKIYQQVMDKARESKNIVEDNYRLKDLDTDFIIRRYKDIYRVFNVLTGKIAKVDGATIDRGGFFSLRAAQKFLFEYTNKE